MRKILRLYRNPKIRKQIYENTAGLPFIVAFVVIAVILIVMDIIYLCQYYEVAESIIPGKMRGGLVLLAIAYFMILYNGTFNLFKHKNPACGAVKYTTEEIDEQVNMDEAKYLPYLNIYLAPKILVGIAKGVTAIEYDDIARISIRHYWVVITTKGGKKLKVSAQRPTLSDDHKLLYKFCQDRNPDIVIDEAKLYSPQNT